jgi:hypothetical protein
VLFHYNLPTTVGILQSVLLHSDEILLTRKYSRASRGGKAERVMNISSMIGLSDRLNGEIMANNGKLVHFSKCKNLMNEIKTN